MDIKAAPRHAAGSATAHRPAVFARALNDAQPVMAFADMGVHGLDQARLAASPARPSSAVFARASPAANCVVFGQQRIPAHVYTYQQGQYRLC